MKRQINENLWGDLTGFVFAKCFLQAVMLVLYTSLQSSVCTQTLLILMSLFTFKLYSESLQICKLSAIWCGRTNCV